MHVGMPPKGKGKGKGRGKSSCNGVGGNQPKPGNMADSSDSGVVAVDCDQEEVNTDQSSDEDNTPLQSLVDQDDDSEKTRRLGRKKKNSEERMFVFSLEEEDELVDWWRDHEYLYNPQHPLYIDKGRKDRVKEKKAKEFGCTSKYKFNNIGQHEIKYTVNTESCITSDATDYQINVKICFAKKFNELFLTRFPLLTTIAECNEIMTRTPICFTPGVIYCKLHL